jgi:carbon-monoxide dehydrogenase small subunit
VRLTVNGTARTARVPARRLLSDCIRHDLRLTGTHVGCEHGVCGACTVLVDGDAVRACLMLAVQAEGTKVVTIEGLSHDDHLTPLQASFRKHHALQCGFCTPGMIMTAVDMVHRLGHELDERTIREELEGNICRCTGYHNIVKSIAAGAKAMKGGGAPSHQAAE